VTLAYLSEPGTIKATLDALKEHPLVDRYGRALPSLSMDPDGWFEVLYYVYI
jgi:hypothetical protein